MSTPTLPPLFYKELMNIQYSRRLLLNNAPTGGAPPSTNSPVDPTEPYNGGNGFDANVVMVLSVLLCALICSLGLNSIIKCAIRCSGFRSAENSSNNRDLSAKLANTGIKKKALKTFAVVNYSPDMKLPGLDTECVICLSEFAVDDKVRLLPKCQHGFHVRCIDKWLNSHSSCPTCRHCLIETCQKIVASSSQTVTAPSQPSETTIVNLAPLEREDLVRCFRGSSQS